MIDWNLAVGLAASALTTIAYIPEVARTVRSKHTRDLSLAWIVILDAGQLLFLIYGVDISSVPLIITSGLAILMLSVMLAYKLTYKNR